MRRLLIKEWLHFKDTLSHIPNFDDPLQSWYHSIQYVCHSIFLFFKDMLEVLFYVFIISKSPSIPSPIVLMWKILSTNMLLQIQELFLSFCNININCEKPARECLIRNEMFWNVPRSNTALIQLFVTNMWVAPNEICNDSHSARSP